MFDLVVRLDAGQGLSHSGGVTIRPPVVFSFQSRRTELKYAQIRHPSCSLPVSFHDRAMPSIPSTPGVYTDGKDYAVYFEETPYGLTLRPVLWTATQLLGEVDDDKFVVVDRASRGAEFRRDANGQVIGVKVIGMDGEGLELKRERGKNLPIELLIDGRPKEAANGYITRGQTKKAIEDAQQVLLRLPSRTHAVEILLRTLAPMFATDAKFYTLVGYTLVQAGKRPEAVATFQRAYRLNPKDESTISALARLNALPEKPADTGWKLPFPLSSVFAKPTAAEMAGIEQEWAKRDLKAAGIKEELKGTIRIAGRDFKLRLVSHLVHGKRHYGVDHRPAGRGTGLLSRDHRSKGSVANLLSARPRKTCLT